MSDVLFACYFCFWKTDRTFHPLWTPNPSLEKNSFKLDPLLVPMCVLISTTRGQPSLKNNSPALQRNRAKLQQSFWERLAAATQGLHALQEKKEDPRRPQAPPRFSNRPEASICLQSLDYYGYHKWPNSHFWSSEGPKLQGIVDVITRGFIFIFSWGGSNSCQLSLPHQRQHSDLNIIYIWGLVCFSCLTDDRGNC